MVIGKGNLGVLLDLNSDADWKIVAYHGNLVLAEIKTFVDVAESYIYPGFIRINIIPEVRIMEFKYQGNLTIIVNPQTVAGFFLGYARFSRDESRVSQITEIWSDIHHSFVTDSKGSIKIAKNTDAVYTSIDNILGTAQGERVMLPEFASRLRNMVFEPIDEALASFLSDEIKRVLEIWDDRVEVIGVTFSPDPDRGYVDITIQFVIKANNEVMTYTKRVGG